MSSFFEEKTLKIEEILQKKSQLLQKNNRKYR